ncbi:MAG: hypothetical protein ACXAD7_19240 [Candidatus Kariarchaeaceae archaeon]|jgi:ketopantoate reductase
MTKESRLSFRIDDNLSHKIDIMVDKHINIRDRSDFGTQSVQFYMDLLDNKETELAMIVKAINSITKKSGITDLPELGDLNELLSKYKDILTPTNK